MTGFVKLDCTILESTIWAEPDDVLRVWIALLAKADSFGVVRSTLPAMANQCRTTLDRMHQILELFKAPDPYSRTPDNEGRRIEDIEGGWLILNYVKHREITQGKPGSHAERQRRYRERVANRDASVTRKSVTSDETGRHKRNAKVTRDTEAEAEAEESKALRLTPLRVAGEARHAVNGFQPIIDAYHDRLPKCERITVLNPKRKRRLAMVRKLAKQLCESQGWRYDESRFFGAYFDECAEDPWMRGEVPNPKNARWKQNLFVLLAEDRFASVMDRAIESMREQA